MKIDLSQDEVFKRNKTVSKPPVADDKKAAKKFNKPVVYYALAVFVLLSFLKLAGASFFQELVELILTFLPMGIIVLMAFVAYHQSKKEKALPIARQARVPLPLKTTLYLLLTTLAFYLLYSPASFSPTLDSIAKFLRLFSMESFFFLLSYVAVLLVALFLASIPFRFYQKSKGTLKGTIRSHVRHDLFGLFFVFVFLFGVSWAAFPTAWRPVTDTLGDLIYTMSFGSVRVLKPDNALYKRFSSVKDLAGSLQTSLLDTSTNLKTDITTSNEKFSENLKDTKDELSLSIIQTNKDLKRSLSDDLSQKLDVNGATVEGNLTVEKTATVEGTLYSTDIVPDNDDEYDLGSPSKHFSNLYIERIHGSSPVIIGSANSSHALSSSSDLVVSGDFEVNGDSFFDSEVVIGSSLSVSSFLDLKNNLLVNLKDPVSSTDAASKGYVDSQLGGMAYFSRVAGVISTATAGDSLDLQGAPITNVGAASTDFSGTGGLTLADKLTVLSNGADITGSLAVSAGLTATSGTITTLSGTTLTYTTGNLSTVDLGTNTISDGSLSGNWSFNSGNLSGIGTLSASSISQDGSSLDDTYVNVSGDTMNGTLNLPSNGLAVGTNQLVVSGGNVGIGTGSPDSKLQIGDFDSNNDTTRMILFGNTQTSSESKLPAIQQKSFLIPGTTQDLALGTRSAQGGIAFFTGAVSADADNLGTGSNTAKVVIKGDGNVGIGTTSPGKLLEINGAAGAITSLLQNNQFYGGKVTDGTAYAILGVDGSNGLQVGTGAGLSDINFYPGSSVAMTIKKTSGNVGIGTGSPGAKLHVFSDNSDSAIKGLFIESRNSTGYGSNLTISGRGNGGTGASLLLQSSGDSGYRGQGVGMYDQPEQVMWYAGRPYSSSFYMIGRKASVADPIAYLYGNTSTDAMFVVNNNGNVGIGTTSPSTRLHVVSSSDGNTATIADTDGTCVLDPESGGSWSCTSDERLKKDITPLSDPLSLVLALNPVSYKMRVNGSQSYGFIAQEVREVYPHAVSELDDGFLAVAEGKMIPYIVGAIQQQQDEISNVKTQISNQIQSLNDQNISIDEKFTIIGTTLDGLASKLKTTAQDVELLENALLTVSDTVDLNNSLVTSLLSEFADHEQRIAALENAVSGSQTGVLGASTEIELPTILEGWTDVLEAGGVKFDADGNFSVKTLELGEQVSGKGVIEEGETEVVVETPEASEEAKILITASGSIPDQILAVTDVEEGESFKVEVKQPAEEEIRFNWLIVR